MDTRLIPTRECGPCNMCCVVLTIDDPALQKPQGFRCRNATRENGCSIYEARPDTCRAFFCGWRYFKWVPQGMRPDVSGVMVRRHREVSRATGAVTEGVIFQIQTKAALKSAGLAEAVAAAVAAEVPVFLSVPGPPGYTSGMARVNDALSHAVITKDKAGLLEALRQCWVQGSKGERRRIQFKPHGAERPVD